MQLEKEIKQEKFLNQYEKLIVNILFTYGWVHVQHIQFFRKYGISPQQYNILRILKGQYPKAVSINLLIERMLDKTSNASRLVDKLKTKNLVKRTPCKADRRQVDVIITEKGIELLENSIGEMNKFIKNYEVITPEEAQLLNDLLDKLRG